MKLIVGAVGKMRRSPELDLFTDYMSRAEKIARNYGLTGPTLSEIEAPKSLSGEALKRRESALMLKTLPDEAAVVAMDEGGKPLSSEAMRHLLVTERDRGAAALAFVIGGADGHGEAILGRSVKTFSFGAATWPHMLVRVMLAEQLYRAMTMLAGHPYHRA